MTAPVERHWVSITYFDQNGKPYGGSVTTNEAAEEHAKHYIELISPTLKEAHGRELVRWTSKPMNIPSVPVPTLEELAEGDRLMQEYIDNTWPQEKT